MGGMFQKDREFGLDITDAFALGERFLLWGAGVQEEKIQTELGEARKTRLIVQRVADDHSADGERFEVTTLASAIADKAGDAEPGDFPCYVELREVQSKRFGRSALVLQWVGDVDDALAELQGGRMNAVTGEIAAETDAPAKSPATGRKG